MLVPEPEMAIIGRLPGYNSAIDPRREFQNQLLKGLTFIDLIPTTYNVGGGIENLKVEFGTQEVLTNLLSDINQAGTIFKHDSAGTRPVEVFQGVLNRMQEGMQLPKSFSQVKSIRIIGANDSTFTENLSNSFDGENGLLAPLENAAKNKWIKPFGTMMAGVKNISHDQAMKFMQHGTGGSLFKDLLIGQALGITFAKPNTWNRSQYSSTLTMFIKLIAPSGTTECIENNIMEPLLYLFAAGSPLTSRGMTYGLPLIWDVHAHGITRFKVGAISSMVISRGSFETTFNNQLQPTTIDVRLTIVPLVQDFAVQHQMSKKSKSSESGIGIVDTITDGISKGNSFITNDDPNLYSEQTKNLGVQHPGDVYQGTMNKAPADSGQAPTRIRTINL